MFPKLEEFQFEKQVDSTIKRSFYFDFEKKQFKIKSGTPVENSQKESIEQWFELLIRTSLDKYDVYFDTGFGTSIKKYIGFRELPAGFIESEFEREVKEASKLNPAILNVSNFRANRIRNGIEVSFTVELKDKRILEVRQSHGVV